jgi:hypothetical protein
VADTGCDLLTNPLQCGQDGLNGIISNASDAVVGSAFDAFVQALVDGANWTIQKLMTLWMGVPSADVGSGSIAEWITGRMSVLVAAAVVASLIVAGIRLALYGKAADARSTAEVLVRTIIVGSIGGTIIASGIGLADAFSAWLLAEAKLDLSSGLLLTTHMMAPGALWLLALVVVFTQLIQVAFMVMRNGFLVVMAGTLTLAAASSSTRWGKLWFERSCAWILAYLAYKPAAALVYAAAFKLASSKNDLLSQLTGIFMMVLAVVALPALMRLFAPMTAAIGSANPGALFGASVGGAVAVGATLASGGLAAGASGAGGFTNFAGSQVGKGGGVGAAPAGAATSAAGGVTSSATPSVDVGGGSTPGGADTSAGAGLGGSATAAASGTHVSPDVLRGVLGAGESVVREGGNVAESGPTGVPPSEGTPS